MIPKAILVQQKMWLSASINSKLNKTVKDGIYLSRFFIERFEPEYLNEILEDWESNKDNAEFIEKLKQIVCDNIKIIEQDIKCSIKNRVHLIDEIFRLFELKYFSSMITLSLSQIDGIMKKITNDNGLYSSNHEHKKINPSKPKYLESEFYISFFSEYELLNIENRNNYELFKKGVKDLSLFNRHSILHGESTNFGHELNATKTILLLYFIANLYSSNNDE